MPDSTFNPRRGLLSSGAPADTNVPTGSPLSSFRTQAPVPIIQPEYVPQHMAYLTPPAPALSGEVAGPKPGLPSPPPSATAKRPSIWDRDHISETLANIGAGFFASQNFGDGLGAAAQTIAKGTRQLRAEGQKTATIGGPDDQFEIVTDPTTGQRTYRVIPEFAEAVEKARTARNAPKPLENVDFRSRAVHAIMELPVEQRQAAYANLIANPSSYGIDTSGMPAAWSDTYGSVAGGMGMKVPQAIAADQRGQAFEYRKSNDAVRNAQRDRALDQGDARVGQGAARVAQGAERLRKAPPSTRKGYSQPKSRAEYNALPSGSKFIAPDGSQRIKP